MVDKNRSPPDHQLRLEWVYGYRSHQCRNNLFYNKNGEVVYFVAGVGIVQNQQERKQRYFLGHNDDILSLAVHPDKALVATGQIGKEPYICVWDSITTETVSILQKGHDRGVSVVNFSGNGELLVSVGQDDHNVLNVWKWKEGKIVATSRGHTDKVLDAQFNPHVRGGTALVSCGVKHIKFWKLCGNTLAPKKGIFGNVGELQTMLCLAFGSEDVTYSGAMSGDVYKWKDRNLIQVISGHHKGAIHSISTCGAEGFATGGADGSVGLWDSSFKHWTQLDLKNGPDGYFSLQVRSVCWERDKILAGTRDSEIFEVSIENRDTPICITQGHAEGELWALAVHPLRPYFATGSDDRTIRMWDSTKQTLVVRCAVPHEVRSLAFSSDGAHLAAGFQGGSFVVLKSEDFSEIIHIKDRKEVLHEMKYSPNGLYLAVGSNDNFVDVYSVQENYKRVGVCKGASSFITHLDWSKDSQYLQINSGAKERLFYHMPDGRHVPSSAATHSIEWMTWTGVLGEEVAGIWPKYSQVNDVNAAHASYHHGTVATSDDFGLVKLFRFPCTAKGAKFKKYIGHSAHVTNVRFLSGDSHVISVGGADHGIFQWKFLPHGQDGTVADDQHPQTSAWVESDTDGTNTDASDVPSLDSDLEREQEKSYTRLISKEEISVIKKRHRKEESGKTTAKSAHKQAAPDTSLSLEFVHGYRGYDCRNNLFYLTNGDIVYHIAALGIVYNSSTHRQRFYGRHTDDILCLALHPMVDVVATGQIGKDPPIHIWNTDTMEPLSVLKGSHERGVCAVDFSADGKKLASVGLDDDHSIVIWDWKKGEQMSTTRGHKDKIFMVKWSPSSSDQLVTVGVKHIKFWTQAGGGLTSKRGIFGRKEKQCTMLCVVYGRSSGHTYTGGSDGRVYHWEGNSLLTAVDAHKGPLFAMQAVEKGFVTGGKDCKVCLWDEPFKKCVKTYSILAEGGEEGVAGLLPRNSAIRALSLGQGKILVGTKTSQVLEIEKSGSMRVLIDGHGEGELWGLAHHPSLPLVATASDDGFLRVWNLQEKRMVASLSLGKQARCVGYSPDGGYLAIGFKDGGFSVLSTEDFSEVATFQHRKQEVSDIKFSPVSPSAPGGKYLAVGSHENFVDIYNIFSHKRVGICKGASSYITHVDWDRDGKLLRVNTGDREVLYFEAPRGKQQFIDRSEDDCIEWATRSGVLGIAYQGIWPPYSDVTDVNAAMVSHDGNVIATGDDFGFVKLFHFPSHGKHAKCKQYSGHSAHVTNVRWSCDNSKLVSTGGADMSVMVWAYTGVESQDTSFPASVPQTSVASDESDTDSEDGEDGGFDSDVEREKNIDYVSKTYVHPARDATLKLKEGTGEKRVVERTAVSRVVTDTMKVARKQTKKEEIKDLTLEFVFGYRGWDTHQNLFYTPSGELLYPAAGAGVVHNVLTSSQSFYLEHNDDITALAINRNQKFGKVVATGQIGKAAPVHVWDYVTKETLSILHGSHGVGVCSVDFSSSGKILMSVGLEGSPTVVVWRWQEGLKVAQAIGSQNRVFVGKFRPDSDSHFVTVGVKHVKFWTIAGTQLLWQRGKIPKHLQTQMQTMLSVAFAPSNVTYTGSISGDVFEWKGNSLTRVVQGAHSGPVFTMFTCLEDGLIVSAGKERSGDGGAVKLWDTGMTRCKQFTLQGIPLLNSPPVIRSVYRSKGKILIGTQDDEIVEIIENGERVNVLLQGHGEGELGGLAASQSEAAIFITASNDMTLRTWDIVAKKMSSLLKFDYPLCSVDISGDGSSVAVGLDNGELVFCRKKKDLQIVNKKRERNSSLTCLRFSPDDQLLAVGSADGHVTIYQTSPAQGVGTRYRQFKAANNAGITHVDWSQSGKYIQVGFIIGISGHPFSS
jgi:WD40 repeat protein